VRAAHLFSKYAERQFGNVCNGLNLSSKLKQKLNKKFARQFGSLYYQMMLSVLKREYKIID